MLEQINSLTRWLSVIAGILLASGCGEDKRVKDRPPLHYASGTVLLDGAPIAGATVTFQPADEVNGKPGFAVTDESGRFVAQTFDPGDGLTAGTHRVAVQKTQMVDNSGQVVKIVHDPGAVKEVHLVPQKYSLFGTSKLEVQIQADQKNKLDPIRLTK